MGAQTEWRVGRAVYGARLESVWVKARRGSNPLPSARILGGYQRNDVFIPLGGVSKSRTLHKMSRERKFSFPSSIKSDSIGVVFWAGTIFITEITMIFFDHKIIIAVM